MGVEGFPEKCFKKIDKINKVVWCMGGILNLISGE